MKQETQDWKQFAIEISSKNGKYHLKVLDSPVGYPDAELDPPYEQEEVAAKLVAFDQLLSLWIQNPQGAEESLQILLEEQRLLGEKLYEALFRGLLAVPFEKSRAGVQGLRAAGHTRGLRIRLVIDSRDKDLAYLATLPWEMLLNGREEERLGCSDQTPILRHLDNEKMDLYVELEPPLKVLLVTACPKRSSENSINDMTYTEFREEVGQIYSKLQGIQKIKVKHLKDPTLQELSTFLDQWPAHVVHFYGHGRFKEGDGSLAFVQPNGIAQWVLGRKLAERLKEHRQLRLVVLNTCKGGVMGLEEHPMPFAGVASALVMHGVPAVVAMQFRVSIVAAQKFSKEFYGSLVEGLPVDAAAARGRKVLLGDVQDEPEWATPAVFTGVGDGRVLRWPRNFQRPDGSKGWRIGIRSISPGEGVRDTALKDCDVVLDLSEYFEGRKVQNEEHWERSILPKTREFLHDQYKACVREGGVALEVELVAHSSIAFAAGYFLDVKTGIPVTVRQRTAHETLTYAFEKGAVRRKGLWKTFALEPDEPKDVADGAVDTVLALSVSNYVLTDVEAFCKNNQKAPHQLRHAEIAPGARWDSVQDGAHVSELALDLAAQLGRRPAAERRGRLHLLASAPNGLLFFLGMVARPIGKIRLYEYAHGEGELGAYTPSFDLP